MDERNDRHSHAAKGVGGHGNSEGVGSNGNTGGAGGSGDPGGVRSRNEGGVGGGRDSGGVGGSRTVRVPTAAAMRELGRRLAGALRAGDLVLLTGPLGAGKTTLTQGLGEGLKVRGPITSPTFVIARVHPSLAGGPSLVHADAYRLGGIDELEDLDFDLQDAVTVVEWGGDIAEGLSDERLEIVIGRAAPESEMAGSEMALGLEAASDLAPESVSEAETASVSEAAVSASVSASEAEERTVTLTGIGRRWVALDHLV